MQAKKSLGQHFLTDPQIIHKIIEAVRETGPKCLLEVGPGGGAITEALMSIPGVDFKAVEIDDDKVEYLHHHFPGLKNRIIHADFLSIQKPFDEPFVIVGNFPYNISSQILFKVLDHRELIPEIVGMFQKEVAERIAGSPGGREYGILSVLMQTWYEVKVIMQLNENDFDPPPKVKSAVLHLIRKENFSLECDQKLFKTVIKTAFNQRRKTLKNALNYYVEHTSDKNIPYLDKRAESLSWRQFVELTNSLSS